jgi:hypothetical protein
MPSSLGCQVVPPGEDYEGLIAEVKASSNPDWIYYTLIDASKIETGLVLVTTQPHAAP